MVESDDTTTCRDANIHTYMNVIREVAGRTIGRLRNGRGVTVSDLESVGGLALTRLMTERPTMPDDEFIRLLRTVSSQRMIDEIRRITHRGREPLVGTSDKVLAEVVERERDEDETPVSVHTHDPGLPDPMVISAKAIRLRRVILDTITPGDVRDILLEQVKKAKAGSTPAAALILKMVTAENK